MATGVKIWPDAGIWQAEYVGWAMMTSSTPTSPTLVVLAAGLGTRYGDVKQLDRVGPGGATLMDYALADASCAGFGRAVVVVRPEIEGAVASHLKDRAPNRMEITFVRQQLGF